MADLPQITTQNIDADVMKSEGVTLLLITTRWCKTGRGLQETVETAADEIGDKLHYGLIDADDEPEIARKLNVQTVPTILFISNGTDVGQVRGEIAKLDLLTRVSEVLTQHAG